MCTNIPVNLPTVVSFLMLYSLSCGCIVILIYTMLRAIFYIVFFMISLIEVYLPTPPPLGSVLHPKPLPPAPAEQYFLVFFAFLALIFAEAMLVVYCIYFGMGLYYDSSGRLKQYLICRFSVWLVEVTILVSLCLAHNHLMGWYLAFLMVVILEFYAFIVVYSYYADITNTRGSGKSELRQTFDARMTDIRPRDPQPSEPRQGELQPVIPGPADPRFADPRYGDPRYGDPRFADPRYGDSRFADPRTVGINIPTYNY